MALRHFLVLAFALQLCSVYALVLPPVTVKATTITFPATTITVRATTVTIQSSQSSLSFSSAAASATLSGYPDFSTADTRDAPYPASPETLGGSLNCPYGIVFGKPVLLVHGTNSDHNTWNRYYIQNLKANGYDPCWIDLPGSALGDMQTSGAYVAYNIHLLNYRTGLKISVIAHSQGNPDTQWALRFWPSTRSLVNSFVALSPDFQGIAITGLSNLCLLEGAVPVCYPAVLQQLNGSNYYAALNLYGHTAKVPTTVIYSLTDEVVVPSIYTSDLPGSNRIAVQDVCPGRVVGHSQMTYDKVGFALALDALNNGGAASKARVWMKDPLLCAQIDMQMSSNIGNYPSTAVATPAMTTSEPPLSPYAIPSNQVNV